MSAPHVTQGKSIDWNTPPEILDPVREFFGGIDLDPCSNPSSLVDADMAYSLPNHNGLKEPWHRFKNETAFINCPFGSCHLSNDLTQAYSAKEFKALKEDPSFDPSEYTKSTIKDWILKGMAEVKNGVSSIFLIPAAVDTKVWQDFIFPKAMAVCWIEGRVNYYVNGKPGGPAPMACALVYFSKYDTNIKSFQEIFSSIGTVTVL